MSTQWEVDLILNISFTCIRLNLSCSIRPCTPIKKKTVAKYLSYKTDIVVTLETRVNIYNRKQCLLLVLKLTK